MAWKENREVETQMKTNPSIGRLLCLIVLNASLYNCLDAPNSSANIHHSLSDFSKPYVAFEDFHRAQNCRTSGIIRKFLSWGHDKSDTIAFELTPLAIEMRRYAALHRKILLSWETGTPVRSTASNLQFLHCAAPNKSIPSDF